MPSLGERLAAEFDAEFTRLATEWFLKWHGLARGETIEVDDFRGGLLRPSSKAFDATAEHAYWSATRRYIDAKTTETFSRIEEEIGLQRGERASSAAEEGAIALRVFLERLHRHAVFTEYRLQARGYPDERYLASRRDKGITADVQRRKVALLEKYGAMSWLERFVLAMGVSNPARLVWFIPLFATVAGAVAVAWQLFGETP